MSKPQRLTKHHRKPKSKNGGDEDRNISHVKENKHAAYHLLFDNKNPYEIAQILTDIWIDPDFRLIAIKR